MKAPALAHSDWVLPTVYTAHNLKSKKSSPAGASIYSFLKTSTEHLFICLSDIWFFFFCELTVHLLCKYPTFNIYSCWNFLIDVKVWRFSWSFYPDNMAKTEMLTKPISSSSHTGRQIIFPSLLLTWLVMWLTEF